MAISEVPVNEIPPGFDLSDHTDRSSDVISVNITLLVIICTIVMVRMTIRTIVIKKLQRDDVLVILATVSQVVLIAMSFYGTRFGLGKHVWNIADDFTTIIETIKQLVKILLVGQIFYSTAITLVKLSIISCYVQVFPISYFRKTMYAMAAVLIAVWICAVFATIFQCHPISTAWEFDGVGTCIPITKFYYFSGSVSLLTDVMLCTMPLPFLWKLQIQKQEKIILTVLFGIGTLACVAAAIRISHLKDLKNQDITYFMVDCLNWSSIEVCVGIFCASAPSLRPLVQRCLGPLSTKRSRSFRSTPAELESQRGIKLPGGSTHDSTDGSMKKSDLSVSVTAAAPLDCDIEMDRPAPVRHYKGHYGDGVS